ncbi:MAG: toll/interleukin-1 receptor domain-containing protein [Candidatus Aminicenantes bacterium]|nr:toll/interleukin-1 receptor domain-containing protein [Candidatus Aminicenantes bacterium]
MKIFISYAHEDRELAGNIKSTLQNEYGFDVFLAHDDIRPTEEWEDVIILNLRKCDVLVALLTKNYINSEWTDQESGFALCREILVIPVKLKVNPRGFIKKYQALTLRTVESASKNIFNLIIDKEDLREDAMNGFIRVYAESVSFEDASTKTNKLLEYDGHLTPQQRNKIVSIASESYQVYQGYRARRRIIRFIAEHGEELDSEIVAQFREVIKG